jgi:phospholipid/cholesterol/gamma-HCH transport system substrate-binding protein
MKNNKGHLWKLGMFVTIGILLFAAVIYIIGKQRNLFGNNFRLQATFSTVSGLEVGNNVRFSGINVGTIDNIMLISDTSVLVQMVIQKHVQSFLKTDAVATIGSEGLMGDKVLIIAPGDSSNTSVKGNAMLASHNPIEMEQIMNSIKVSAENAEIITGELAEFTFKLNNGNGTLSKLIGDDQMANTLNRTMQNLENSAEGLNENMEAAKSNFLLRGYFKKKEKEKQDKIDAAKKKAEKDNEKPKQ